MRVEYVIAVPNVLDQDLHGALIRLELHDNGTKSLIPSTGACKLRDVTFVDIVTFAR